MMHLRRSVREIRVPVVVNVRAIHIAPDLADQRIAIGIQLAAAGHVQQFEAIEQRSTRAAPIAGAFVAAAVFVVAAQETDQRSASILYTAALRRFSSFSNNSAEASQLELIQGVQLFRLPSLPD